VEILPSLVSVLVFGEEHLRLPKFAIYGFDVRPPHNLMCDEAFYEVAKERYVSSILQLEMTY
jgi:hypothetical protein